MIADFGTNYTDIGWLTIVLPLLVLALVTGWWHLSFRRHKREDEIIEPPVLHHGGEKSKAADS